jgi:hypothetical protein
MAAARAALICPLAAAAVVGATVKQKATMVVASTSFVAALANKFGAGLPGFGAICSSSPKIERRDCKAKKELHESL